MAKREVAAKKTRVDPLFVVPPGSEDEFVYSSEMSDYDAFLDSDEGEGTTSGELAVPQNFTIVEQILRRAPGGQQFVDVVIETDDIEGAVSIEFQISKVEGPA